MIETFVVRIEDMEDLAKKVVAILKDESTPDAKVLFLEGDLGTGKTTFTKELAHVLGIDKEEVHSPTFILKKEYKGNHVHFRKLIHVDAYRFDDKEEGNVLRLEDDIKDRQSIIAIEWPSKMHTPNPDMSLRFSVVNDDTREVTLLY